MPDVFAALSDIAASRGADPLHPVTVIAPSHAAALHLRRSLARMGPFAGVRFETLPRVAELLAAGRLAEAGRSPLARPIGDYLAAVVAQESRGELSGVRDLPGYARTLRRIFARLRRAGIRGAAAVSPMSMPREMAEILRLYDRFRVESATFYDIEDLLDGAAEACKTGVPGIVPDLGDVYIVPPGAETAAGNDLLRAIRHTGVAVTVLDDPLVSPTHQFTVSPDPASEAREIARSVVEDLGAGLAIDEVAVFYGADRSYAVLLREAFDAARIPAAPLPGAPLIETRAGRAAVLLAELPESDFSRTAVMEFLNVAPLKRLIPAGDAAGHAMASAWDSISREAGITRGAGQWQARLALRISDRDAEIDRLDPLEDDRRIAAMAIARDQAAALRDTVATLATKLESLMAPQDATAFIKRFKGVVAEYIDAQADGMDEVLEEIDQLGTVGAVGGSFTLGSFAQALRANLAAAYIRPTRLGDGIVIADYRVAAGMRFEKVLLAGAYEGAFPAGPGADAIFDDTIWRRLKTEFPYVEDVQTRIDRSRAAARRAVGSAGDGSVMWWTPAYQPGGNRDFYPSPEMVRSYNAATGARITATQLREGIPGGDVRRIASPLAGSMRGTVLDGGELGLRLAVAGQRDGGEVEPAHARWRAVQMLRARWSRGFTEWDGNAGGAPMPKFVSPTALEHYAACGYRYFAKRVLWLNMVAEPAEQDTMDAMTRGSLIHDVLEQFFRDQQQRGRPAVREAWTDADTEELLELARHRFEESRARGETGYDLYADHDLRTIQSDLAQFLIEDNTFRWETGAVPAGIEVDIPESQVAGVTMRGRVDRIDQTPDKKSAWVIDYKTGSSREAKKIRSDPLLGGTKLQLPWYITAVRDADRITALYWHITQRGNFERIPYEPSPELDARFERTVEAIIGGVGAGVFPAVPGDVDEYYGTFSNCKFCDFKRICTVRRDLAYEAKAQDPAMSPWKAVAEAAKADET